MAECGCDAVKLEGGRNRAKVINSLVNASIPVIGHIGFTPQAMPMHGEFKAAGLDAKAALRLLDDAKLLEESGICMLMLEAVPADIAAKIADRAAVPVIGFGSGPYIDGQILLLHDLIGMFDSFTRRFSKQYVDVGTAVTDAMRQFLQDVENGTFPASEHYFEMPAEESQGLRDLKNQK
jgi:3-methyl-2-oxobutanoate hydroxymethyltransferase